MELEPLPVFEWRCDNCGRYWPGWYTKCWCVKVNKLKFLGWANGWSDDPDEVKLCKEEKHRVTDQSDAPGVPYKCFVHTVTCDKCGYYYKYDSS
jgi:hypothetical protein